MECPRCGESMVKRGLRKTRLARKQLYFCHHCRRKTTVDWPRMRYSQKTVMSAVDMYSGGSSLSEVQARLKSRGIKVSRWTIMKWFRKFGKEI